jgi:hypothetical protein
MKITEVIRSAQATVSRDSDWQRLRRDLEAWEAKGRPSGELWTVSIAGAGVVLPPEAWEQI